MQPVVLSVPPLTDGELIQLIQQSLEHDPSRWTAPTLLHPPPADSQHPRVVMLYKELLLFVSALAVPRLGLYSRLVSEVLAGMEAVWARVLGLVYRQERLASLISQWVQEDPEGRVDPSHAYTSPAYTALVTSIKSSVLGMRLLDEVIPRLIQYPTKTSVWLDPPPRDDPPVLHPPAGSNGSANKKRDAPLFTDDYERINIQTCK